jgi:hypothetical protein
MLHTGALITNAVLKLTQCAHLGPPLTQDGRIPLPAAMFGLLGDVAKVFRDGFAALLFLLAAVLRLLRGALSVLLRSFLFLVGFPILVEQTTHTLVHDRFNAPVYDHRPSTTDHRQNDGAGDGCVVWV